MKKRSFDLTTAVSSDHYKLLTGLVIPRPIGWIGTKRDDGQLNLAPFSFFNAVSSQPPIVLFSAGRHVDRPKDSLAFAERSGVFTVNIVSEELADAMNKTSGSFDLDEDEFAIAGLTVVMGTVVDAPMVGEAPANLECRVVDVIDVGAETRMVLGEVVMMHVREDALDGTRVDSDVLRAIGRLSGRSYVTTRDRFELERPT
ncbi:MAG TPA: flavin reductase family protein [Acidimicrobiia bacterium]|nr:flavin reductase family protein [Acidimicrobiia bacterium]HLF59778.1 flavin reductase family protein [Acidimicrobiia bacterium]